MVPIHDATTYILRTADQLLVSPRNAHFRLIVRFRQLIFCGIECTFHELMAKRKLIIDCDAGVDDAQAIILALSHEDVEVLAITCVVGNTSIDQVCVNVLKVLELCDRTDIPVFKGAAGPLVGKEL